MKQISLSDSDQLMLSVLAEWSSFWQEISDKYAEFGGLTPRQYEIFKRDAERVAWRRGAERIGGLPVRNRFRTASGAVRCATRQTWCSTPATIVIGTWGYCREHAPAAAEELREWRAAREAERAQERAAEAVGK